MADGDVKFFRFPIVIDPIAPADTTLQTLANTLLVNAVWDIVNTTVIRDPGINTNKAVVVIVARAKS